MKKSRFIKPTSILLVILLVLSLSACGATKSDSVKTETTSSNEQTTEAITSAAEKIDPLEKYDPAIEVTATRMVPDSVKFVDGETWDDNKIEKVLYEDSLGIKIKYMWTAPAAQFDQKMAVSMASDDLADYMRVYAKQLNLLADSDKLLDLTELYEKYATETVKKCYGGDGGVSLGLGKINNKLFALSQPASPMDTPYLVWVRNDWLKKLNLPEPKTMNDLFTIMDAFVNKDPDGNGKKDTRGLGLEKAFGGFAGTEGFFNGYHAYPNSWIKDGQGNLVSGLVQPEVKTALLKLQELYKSGVIDKEFGVKDATKIAEETTNGKIGLIFGQMWNPLWPFQDSINKDNSADWRPYPLVSIDDKPALPTATIDVSAMQFLVVNKNAKHPEAAIKILNIQAEQWTGLFYGNDKFHQVIPKALTDEYNDKGVNQAWMYQFFEISPANKNLNEHLMSVDIVDGKQPDNTALQSTVDAIKGYEKDGQIDKWGMAMVFGHKGTFNIINNSYFIPKNYMMNEFFGAPTKTMIEKNATLTKQQLEVFTKIIMGDSIDTYDKFIDDWSKLGGDDITKEVNDWYKSK